MPVADQDSPQPETPEAVPAGRRRRIAGVVERVWAGMHRPELVAGALVGLVIGGAAATIANWQQASSGFYYVVFTLILGFFATVVNLVLLRWVMPKVQHYLRMRSKYSYANEFLYDALASSERIAIFAGDLDFLWSQDYDLARERLRERGGRGIYIFCYDPAGKTVESRRLGAMIEERIGKLVAEYDVQRVKPHKGDFKGLLCDDVFGLLTHTPPPPGWLSPSRIIPTSRADYMIYVREPEAIVALWELVEDLDDLHASP